MASVLNDESTSQPGFKFEQSLNIYHFATLVVSSIAFILMLTYTFQNLDSSAVTSNYKGLLTKESNRSFYFVEVIPPLKDRQILLNFVRVNSNQKLHISIHSNINCQWSNDPPINIKQNLNNITNGAYNLFNTKVYLHKPIIIQLQISILSSKSSRSKLNLLKNKIRNFLNEFQNKSLSGFIEDNNRETIISIDSIQNNLKFGNNIIVLRIIFFSISLSALLLFVILILFFSKVNPNSFRFEQYLTIFSLLFSVLANFPYSHYTNTLTAHFFEAVFLGFFGSFNVAALYLFVQKANGQNVNHALPVTFLFLIAQAFFNLTSDSAFLSIYFEDNYVVVIFFTTVSVIAHGAYMILFIQSIVSSLCSPRATRKKLFVSYLLAFFVLFVPLCEKLFSYALNGFANFAFAFCYDYMAQTFLALLFTDIHWPLVSGSTRVTTIGAIGEDELILHVAETA